MIRLGGVAAVVAGACWVVKATVILLTGKQPPIAFELPFGLFPVALVGLYAVSRRQGGTLATCGLVIALSAEMSAVAVGVGALLGPEEWLPREDTVTVLTPFIVLGGSGPSCRCCCLGWSPDVREPCPDGGDCCRWRSLSPRSLS